MKRILNAAQMKAADSGAIENGVPSLVLMERAALSVVQTLLHRKNRFDLTRTYIFCGTGNNAGDGVAIARILDDYGYHTVLVMTGKEEKYSEAMKQQVLAAKNRGISMVSLPDLNIRKLEHATLLIDAIFGIGLTRQVKGDYEYAISLMNAQEAPIVAVDIPSGVHTDTGSIMGCACRCEMTVTFARAKRGMLLYPGAEFSGEVVVKEIGIPVAEMSEINDTEDDILYHLLPEDLQKLPKRDESGNKGTFGKLLVIAGSKNIFGAAALCAEAALRTGAGMVKVFTEESNRIPLCTRVPEVLISTYNEEDGCSAKVNQSLKEALEWCDGVVIGPGIGTSIVAKNLLIKVLEYSGEKTSLPVVYDADALNLLAANPEQLAAINCKAVFTPHMAEMSRLSGIPVRELKEDPIRNAEEFAKKCSLTLVMKDARTVIANAGRSEHPTYLNIRGNSALSTAGSGDVLAGIIGTLWMQGIHPAYGVLIHSLTGERAAAKSSRAAVIAGDLPAEIGGLMECTK